jgi:hypothetical protein
VTVSKGAHRDEKPCPEKEEPMVTTIAPNASPEERRFVEENQDLLSKSTLRAKWIHGRDERADRRGQTLATRSHDVIRAWAKARNARPATVARRQGERPRTLRLDFNEPTERLQPIDWDEWLRVFDDRSLVFLYQENRRDGRQSNFWRLDSPERQEG